MMILTKYIAYICEDAAEKVIMELLLDANMLTFTQDDLLDGELIRCRSAKNFEEQYLRKGFTEKITVLRILDSRREQFKLIYTNLSVLPYAYSILSSNKSDAYKNAVSALYDYYNATIAYKN